MDIFRYLATVLGMWLLNNYGVKIASYTAKEVQKRWQYIFHKRNIVILGYKGTGKTSLIYYLLHGKPYLVHNKQVQHPEPTVGSVVIDTDVKISQETQIKWAKIMKDVSGDRVFRELWTDLIDEIEPQGIIYLVDGRLSKTELEQDVETVFEDILPLYQKRNKGLIAFHIFISFADQWATARHIKSTQLNNVRLYFEDRLALDEFDYLQNLHFEASIVHLAPDEKSWIDTDRALEKFGADLADG